MCLNVLRRWPAHFWRSSPPLLCVVSALETGTCEVATIGTPFTAEMRIPDEECWPGPITLEPSAGMQSTALP